MKNEQDPFRNNMTVGMAGCPQSHPATPTADTDAERRKKQEIVKRARYRLTRRSGGIDPRMRY